MKKKALLYLSFSFIICITNYSQDIIGIYDINTIDYSNPEKFLNPGKQSDLKDKYLDEIKSVVGDMNKKDMTGIAKIFAWYQRYFTTETAGGAMIAQYTINDLYENRKIYGCHSASLILASVLREFGYPAILIDTSSIDWAYKYNSGTADGMVGHVMTEVFVEGRWILLDTSGKYITNYNPKILFIPPEHKDEGPSPKGLFVMRKGIDHWSYGVTKPEDVEKLMKAFAKEVKNVEKYLINPGYKWETLNRNVKINTKNIPKEKKFNNKTTVKKDEEYPVDLIIHYKFKGKGAVNSKNKIFLILDKTDHGYGFKTIWLTKSTGTIKLKGFTSPVSTIYIEINYDRDGSGWHTKGDPHYFYGEKEGYRKGIEIGEGQIEITIEFDDSFIFNQ